MFDDFIAAAEYLKAEGYTRTDRLAIRGGFQRRSAGGAVMTQRPDLMRSPCRRWGCSTCCATTTPSPPGRAGIRLTHGTSADSEAMFDYLKGYSAAAPGAARG